MGSFEPRGVRNCNPGNIRKDAAGAWRQWQGLAAEQTDAEFVAFKAPVWGVRAIVRTLMTYFDKHGCDTPAKVIARWAPPVENDSAAYAKHLARALGVDADATIDLHDYATMRAAVETIIRHENGQQPYSRAVLDEALRLAGLVPPAKPVAADPKVIAATVVATATAAQQVTGQVFDIWDKLVDMGINPHVLFGALGLAALVAALWFLAETIRRRRAGVA